MLAPRRFFHPQSLALLPNLSRGSGACGEHSPASGPPQHPNRAASGQRLLPPPSNPNQYFSLNAQALCSIRTPGQVLYLAYGGAAGVSSARILPRRRQRLLQNAQPPQHNFQSDRVRRSKPIFRRILYADPA